MLADPQHHGARRFNGLGASIHWLGARREPRHTVIRRFAEFSPLRVGFESRCVSGPTRHREGLFVERAVEHAFIYVAEGFLVAEAVD